MDNKDLLLEDMTQTLKIILARLDMEAAKLGANAVFVNGAHRPDIRKLLERADGFL